MIPLVSQSETALSAPSSDKSERRYEGTEMASPSDILIFCYLCNHLANMRSLLNIVSMYLYTYVLIMDQVNANKDGYKALYMRHDPTYADQVSSIEVVKKFIIDNNLIVYGGTAIDYALRLHGDKIYADDMLAVPDLDFYSPENVEHAYQLADILFAHGWKEARAINALHMLTMKVDVRDNHWVADISYVPKSIFDGLPTVIYEGMRCIHPHFQRIDMHSALTYPYDSPPREVVFNRWAKDVKRFNHLNQYYPISWPKDTLPSNKLTLTTRKYPLAGFAAYALMYNYYKLAGGTSHEHILAADFVVTKQGENTKATFDTYDLIEFIHFDVPAACEYMKLAPKYYEPYVNMTPMRAVDGKTVIYSSGGKLLSVNSVTIGDIVFRVVNVQWLLKHFLAMSFISASTSKKMAAVYIRHYLSLIEMTKLNTGPLALSMQAYGNENIELSHEIILSKIYLDLGKGETLYAPTNYNVAKSVAAGRDHPDFDYTKSKFFRIDGKEITMNTELTPEDSPSSS